MKRHLSFIRKSKRVTGGIMSSTNSLFYNYRISKRNYNNNVGVSYEGISNSKVTEFIETYKKLMNPEAVHVVEGTDEEYQKILDQLVEGGTLTKLNEQKRPGSYLARSGLYSIH